MFNMRLYLLYISAISTDEIPASLNISHQYDPLFVKEFGIAPYSIRLYK